MGYESSIRRYWGKSQGKNLAPPVIKITPALLHCWWECKLVEPLWRTVWSFLKKLRIELPYDPAIPLLGTYPEENHGLKGYMHPVFIAALFRVAKAWKRPRFHLQRNG